MIIVEVIEWTFLSFIRQKSISCGKTSFATSLIATFMIDYRIIFLFWPFLGLPLVSWPTIAQFLGFGPDSPGKPYPRRRKNDLLLNFLFVFLIFSKNFKWESKTYPVPKSSLIKSWKIVKKMNNRFLDEEKRLSLSEWPLWVELPLIGLLERLPPKPPRRDFIVDIDR